MVVYPIKDDLDIIAARGAAREMAMSLGFGIFDQARIAAAVSELARRVSGTGKILIHDIRAARTGLEVCGWIESEASRAGALRDDLITLKSVVDDFEITSDPDDCSIQVTIRKWLR